MFLSFICVTQIATHLTKRIFNPIDGNQIVIDKQNRKKEERENDDDDNENEKKEKKNTTKLCLSCLLLRSIFLYSALWNN